MKEKILELLKTKFVGVSETTLSRMAEKAAKTATTEELVTTYLDGVSFQNVIDSEADYRATKATQTSIDNYEKKHNIKDGKPIAKSTENKTDEPDSKSDDEVPAWAKPILGFATMYAEDKKASIVKTKKEKLVEKLIELGAKKDDKDVINTLVDMIGVNEDADVDEKAATLLTVYNKFKKPEGSGAPNEADKDGDVDKFAKLLETAKE